MASPVVINQETKHDRVRAAARTTILAKLNRMLLRRPVDVKYGGNSGPYGAAAWTDGTNVYLANWASGTPWRDLLGANYHEIAHILYTPSVSTKVGKAVAKANVFRAYNLLEDMRIEALMIDRWRPLVGFYTLMFNRFVVTEASQLDRAYLFAAGRRYLPVELRAKFRAAYVRQDDLADIDRIVTEYCTIDPRKEVERTVLLATEFSTLMYDANARYDEHIGDITSSGDVDASEIAEQIERIRAEFDADQDELEDQTEGHKVPVPGGKNESEDGEAAGQEATDQPAGGGEDEASDTDDELTGGIEGGEGDSERTSLYEDILEDLKELTEQMETDVNEIADRYEDAEKAEIDRLLDDYEVGTGLDASASFGATATTDREQHKAARRLSKKFDRLVDELAPHWERHHRAGRLDLKKVVRSKATGKQEHYKFRRWESGEEDDASIEVGIAIDMSGSMSYRMGQAARTLWTIRRTFDLYEGEANVSVVGFDTMAYPLFGHRDRPKRNEYKVPKSLGGTMPSVAVAELYERFRVSEASHKFLFILTDGWFHDGLEVAALVNRLRAETGTLTTVVGIGCDVDQHTFADETHTINRMDDLLPMIDSLVTQALQAMQGA